MTTTTRTLVTAMIAGAMAAYAAAARAQEEAPQQPPNYRCENAKAKAEAWEFGCLYRCDRRAQARPASEREAFFAACATDCHERCDEKKARIEAGPLCRAEVPAPNPRRCAARHLAALSQLNLCLSFCPAVDAARSEQENTPPPRGVVCQSNCEERYAAMRERADGMEACMSGGTPVCVYQ